MKWLQRFDKISALLLFFIFLLVVMFFYLYTVEKDVKYYTIQEEKIVALKLLDKEINDFSLSMNQFDNYDDINQKSEQFKTTLASLKKDLQVHYPNHIYFLEKIKTIEKNLNDKLENIDYFKSLNSSLIAGSHFLFDLQSTISDEQDINIKTKSLINETLFYILRYTTSNYIEKDYVEKKLSDIKESLSYSEKQHLANFYKQSFVMLNIVTSLKEVSKDMQTSPLYKRINNLNDDLMQNYNNNLRVQKQISMILFITAIVILMILIKMHLSALKVQEELLAFKFAMQHSDNTIVITDKERKITFVNEVFEKTTGYSSEEVIGQNPRILKSGRQDESVYIEMNKKLNSGQKWEGEFINKKKDGSLFYEKASIVPVFLGKKLINYLAIKLDITQYIEQNKKLAQAASIFEHTEESIIITDAEGKVTSINTAFSNIYGYKLNEITGQNLSFLQSGEQDKNFYIEMWNQLIENGIWKGKLINKTKEGEMISVWTTIKKITDNKDEIVNYTAVQTDLRELESSQDKANYLAYHDALTGLYNRINFEEYLIHALIVANRNTTILAVLFIDLDRFKIINDTLGHDIGDEVLKAVASRLKESLRDSDIISRWGGDEFVVILENLTSPSDTAFIATNIIENIKEPIDIGEHSLIITASIGIALYPENGKDTSTLVKHADSAMYLAKETGKNNFRYYTKELSQDIQYKLDIDLALRNALKNSEFYTLFQPQYRLDTKTMHSVETLIRWKSASLGIIPPDEFIPVAEENGTIIKLGYFVFEESCKAFKKMKRANPEMEYIAINVSSLQFREVHLLETFMAIAKRHNIEPHEIEIEITERLIMDHTIANMNILQNFRNYGFKISIDDFGTGYSSMSYLKQLPIDTIKIDKSFVDDIALGNSNNAVIEAIIALSKTLGYQIVAEGIETQEQEDFLSTANCDLGQGYYFSRPISCDEIILFSQSRTLNIKS